MIETARSKMKINFNTKEGPLAAANGRVGAQSYFPPKCINFHPVTGLNKCDNFDSFDIFDILI